MGSDVLIGRYLAQHPELVVACVRELRKIAGDSTLPQRERRQARAVLVKHGFDDATLRTEAIPSSDAETASE